MKTSAQMASVEGDTALTPETVRDIARIAARDTARDSLCDAIRDAAAQAASTAVSDVLERLGFDVADPRATRQDADWLREARLRSADPECQRDRLHLRNHRLAQEQMAPMIRRTAIALIVTGLATAMWLGVREMVTS